MQQQILELEQAILRDDISAIEALAAQPDFKLCLEEPVSVNDSMLPLAYACYLGHQNAVRCLVAHGADPCEKDGYGWTAMTWLLDITTSKLSEQERCELFELLLSVGGQPEINFADYRDMTLCDWCTTYKQNVILNYLREKGGLTKAELDSQPYLEIIGGLQGFIGVKVLECVEEDNQKKLVVYWNLKQQHLEGYWLGFFVPSESNHNWHEWRWVSAQQGVAVIPIQVERLVCEVRVVDNQFATICSTTVKSNNGFSKLTNVPILVKRWNDKEDQV